MPNGGTCSPGSLWHSEEESLFTHTQAARGCCLKPESLHGIRLVELMMALCCCGGGAAALCTQVLPLRSQVIQVPFVFKSLLVWPSRFHSQM